MINYKSFILISISTVSIILPYDRKSEDIGTGTTLEQESSTSLGKIGDYGSPNSPLLDRAKGYALDGKIKSAISNYGNFIDWRFLPAGQWGNYQYLPHVGFMAGVPGQANSGRYGWTKIGIDVDDSVYEHYWVSTDLYDDWYNDLVEEKFSGLAYNIEDDRGELCNEVDGIDSASFLENIECAWNIDDSVGEVYLFLLDGSINPNESKSRIGAIYTWALRPKLRQRLSDYDMYEYGFGPGDDGIYGTDDDGDQEEWTDDDEYVYFGYSVSESWFSEGFPNNSDWQPKTLSRTSSHAMNVQAGDVFGSTPYSDSQDSYPLLAHSKYTSTWPERFNEYGKIERYWPGWWAKEFYGDRPDEWLDQGIVSCNGLRSDQGCWKEVEGKFVSDNDIYMEFDDRWAHRGNLVDGNRYLQTGYPLGLSVRAEAHSYGVEYAEDIMFFTVKVRNESGRWTDDDGKVHDGLVMPDGTILNGGRGFNYNDMYLGFYFDSIVVWADYLLNFGVWSNTDDFMGYYWDKIEHMGDSLMISLAMTYDYDMNSNGATDIGIVSAQLLDTPLATREVDLDKDGFTDIYPGEPLKITDWHWFDWYNRPGVVSRESGNNCCAGYPGRAQAANKEEIMYKIMAGDTTNLSLNEKNWFFHTPNPVQDSPYELNPHFDSLDGLTEEQVFQDGEDGFDCIFIMSSGPFDINVGEEVPFSFCVIFGENKEDLIANAEFAQLMYNSNYQGFTAPKTPHLSALTDNNKVTLVWDDLSIYSRDVLTGYSDFEGYKIYRSKDGGATWGDDGDMILDDNGIHVGWQPIAQFDLTSEEDSLFCQYGFESDYSCVDGIVRGYDIQGHDPYSPWLSLGSNSGLPEVNEYGQFTFTDTGVTDGIEYTYSVTAYDTGIRTVTLEEEQTESGGVIINENYPGNPDKWAQPLGYKNIESPKGTTIHDPNFITVTAGTPPVSDVSGVSVVPNPYVVRSDFNETEYGKKIRFINLPEECTITIYTINGEKVAQIEHYSQSDGNEWWDLRTINNQEAAPGLYLYRAVSTSSEKIGRFAIVR